jgi:electron-transferring-flavoprotein dehydrogenase
VQSINDRDEMAYDVIIVGGGPAGLAASVRLKQIDPDLSVCLLEKGSEIGAHILSGAVVDPRALDELLPGWRESDCPLNAVPVTENLHWYLTAKGRYALPHAFMPPLMSNDGNFTGSLGSLCRWLAERAEALGVEIFAGFPAAEVLYDAAGAVIGVQTGDMGMDHEGRPKADFQPGMNLTADYTLFCEGARGHLTKRVKARYDLEANCQPQVYGLGIKELWDIDPAKHKPGRVIHTQGWPLNESGTWGGGFLYHQDNNQVALGLVTALDYANPYVHPFEEFQRWKQHPAIRAVLEGGRRVAYGARAINEGGWQSVPQLAFPGGVLAGCSAGFVNVPRIKGTHTAMKSGMLAAEAVTRAIRAGRRHDRLIEYDRSVRASWIAQELQLVQNAQPLVTKWNDKLGTCLAGADMWLRSLFGFGLSAPMKHQPDATRLQEGNRFRPIVYPRPDGAISFDRLTSVAYSFTNHEENQPVHLRLRDPEVPGKVNLPLYRGPEERYCPAGVYEYVEGDQGGKRLQINAQNCLHCKTCDIKDPAQNIEWVCPEGGGGPNYPNM